MFIEENPNPNGGMDAERAWVLMDELMSAVQITNKRLYDSVMRKIAE